ncbi:MAG: penicillin-binding transpeptidase domain-containing protein [Chitinophagaceae bacterium]
MKQLSAISLLAILLLNASCRDARIKEHKEWAGFFSDAKALDGGIILRDQAHDAVAYYNLNRDTQHLSPASTFKIVLSLAGLELGILQDDKFVIPWDGIPTGKPEWEKDLSLREAFETSSEPYFKELARRIGRERLQHMLDTLNYGNKKLGDSVSTCWTDGSLKISADEQVGLMKRLYFDELPLSDRTQRIVRSLMLHETEGGRKMYYKTGWGRNGNNSLLWVVGFAEYEIKVKEMKGSMNKAGERNYVYFFAENIDIPSDSDPSEGWRDRNIRIAKQVLDNYVNLKQH